MSKRTPKAERQQMLYEIVRQRGHVTSEYLSSELHVSERTIRSDVMELMCQYPIEMVQGNGGGVRLQEGISPLKLAHSPEEIAVLNKYKQLADCPEDLVIFEQMIRKCCFS